MGSIKSYRSTASTLVTLCSTLLVVACGSGSGSVDQDVVTEEPTFGAALEESSLSALQSVSTDSNIIVEQASTQSITSTTAFPASTEVDVEPEPATVVTAEPEPAPVATADPEPAPVVTAEPEPAPVVAAEPEPAPVATAEPEPAPVVAAEPEPTPAVAAEPEPAPDVAAEPEPAPVVAAEPEPETEELVDRLAVGLEPGHTLVDRQCLTITPEEKSRGDVASSDWRAWLPNYTYDTFPENLSVHLDDDGAFLTQRLEPSSRGSTRVQAGANVNSAKIYRLTQSLYFEEGFDWGGKNEGGKVGFGLGGGSNPTGGIVRTDGFSLRFMWRGHKDGTAHLAAYSYAADRAQNLPFGDDYRLEGFTIPTGEWFDITTEITVNSSIDAADGLIRVWANGQEVLHRDSIAWQTSGDAPSIQKFIFATFFGGSDSSWSPDLPVEISFRNVCWSAVNDGVFNDGVGNDPQEDLIFDDWVFRTSRIQLSDALRDVELSLPLNTAASNRLLVNVMDKANESLVPKNWESNDSLAQGSNTISKLRESVELIETLKGEPGLELPFLEDINSLSSLFANQAIFLAERGLAQLQLKSNSEGCETSLGNCGDLNQDTQTIRDLLDISYDVSAPINSLYSTEAAWNLISKNLSD